MAVNNTLSSIRDGGNSTPWQAPAEWLPLPAPQENRVHILRAVTPGNNFFAVQISTSAGNYTVDLGNGQSPQTFASGTIASLNLDYSTYSSTNESVLGYRQAIITIAPVSGNLTSIRFNQKHASTAANIPNESGILDLNAKGNAVTTLNIGSSGSTVQVHRVLKRVYLDFPNLTAYSLTFVLVRSLESATILLRNGAVSLNAAFEGCSALENVRLISGTSTTISDMTSAFQGCSSLIEAPILNTTGCTAFANAFSGCTRLRITHAYNTSSATNCSSMYASCSALIRIPDLVIPVCTNITSIFSGCTRLVKLPSITSGSALANITSFAQGCAAITEVVVPSTVTNVTTATSAFQDCINLRRGFFSALPACTNASSMWRGCFNMESLQVFALPVCTNLSSFVRGCTSLSSFPAFNVSAATNVANMFDTCSALKTIANLNFAAVSSTANAASLFNACNSLAVGRTSGLTYTVSYSNCQLSQSEILEIFTGLGAAAGAQTITITGNPGASGVPTTIATSKGWTVVGA